MNVGSWTCTQTHFNTHIHSHTVSVVENYWAPCTPVWLWEPWREGMGYLWCPADWTKGEQTKAAVRLERGLERGVIRLQARDLRLRSALSLRCCRAAQQVASVHLGAAPHGAAEVEVVKNIMVRLNRMFGSLFQVSFEVAAIKNLS